MDRLGIGETNSQRRGLKIYAVLSLMAFACAAFSLGPKIALVPVVNLAGENWEQLKARQSNTCNAYLHDQFADRGFQISRADEVLSEMKRENVDFNDEEQQKRATLFKLGHELHVDYIVLAVITDTLSTKNSHIVYTDSVGHATVKLWLLDIVHEKAILSAKKVDSESGGSRLTIDNKASDRQVQAAVNAIRDGLKDFLSGWPVTVKPARKRH